MPETPRGMTRPSLPSDLTVLERGWLSSNNVLCFGGDGPALIDSGYGTHSEQTLALLHAQLGGAALHRLINTHLHSDHCGGNAAIQRVYRPQTLIPPGGAPAVARWDPDRLTYRATGQECPPFSFDALLVPGQTVRAGRFEWTILAAPGHDPDSVVLWEPASRTLVSADALWENGFGVVFPELLGEPGFGAVRQTLDVIAGLDARAIIPGHGAPFFEVAPALERAYRRLAAMQADPLKHARHGLKVLMKFHLLQVQRVPLAELLAWCAATPYFEQVRGRYFEHSRLDELARQLVEELIGNGVLATGDGMVVNT